MSRRLTGTAAVAMALAVVAILARCCLPTHRDGEGPQVVVSRGAHERDGARTARGDVTRPPTDAVRAGTVPPSETAPGRWLSVTVRTAQGAPVPGALVTVQMQAIDVPADAEGRALLGPLRPGPATAWAGAPGFVQEEFQVPAEGEGGGALERRVVLQLALSIAGRVAWADGSPAAGVDVEIQWSGHTKTDGEGRFSLDGLAPGEHILRVGRDRGWRWGGVDGVQTMTRAGATGVLLMLPDVHTGRSKQESEPRRIDVYVTDADGAPVPRFTLTTHWANGDGREDAENGHARIRADDLLWVAASGAWGASAADGPLPLGPAVWRGPLAEDASEIRLRLPPGRSVSGLVSDEQGRPIPDAIVVATASSVVVLGGLAPSARAQADAAGRWRIEGLPDGACTLVVDPPPGWDGPGVPLRAMAGQTDVALVLRRTDDTEATLTVLDDSGARIPGALVRWWAWGTSPLSGTTDAAGLHRLRGWARGSVGELTVWPPDSTAGRTLVEWTFPRWHPGDQVIRLERGFVTSGVVRNAEGVPVEHADVEVRSGDGSWEARSRTDASGNFHLPAMPAGLLTLRAHARGAAGLMTHKAQSPVVSAHVGDVREVPAGTSNVILEVDLGPSLRVQFDGWPTVSPTIDAMLVAERVASRESTDPIASRASMAPVSAHGSAEFIQLDRDGTYSLWVGPLLDGRIAWARGLPGASGVQTIALVPGLRTVVRVSGPGMRRGVEVTAQLGEFTVRAVRGVDGSFHFTGLPTGSWPVYASTGFGESKFAGEATVTAGGEAEIVLEPLPPPSPSALDLSGK